MPVIENKSDNIKPGTIMAFPSNSVPNGWLPCNGVSLNKNLFSDLFNAIGYTYGGSGNNFNIPDLRGRFIRGYGTYDGGHVSEQLGNTQIDTLQNHRHRFAAYGPSDGGGPGRSGNGYNWDAWTSWLSEDGFRNSAETRPINMAMVFCIKY